MTGARARVLAAAVILAASTSCRAQGAAAVHAPLPAGPHVVGVRMREYRFDFAPVVPSGRVVFHVSNVGRDSHHLILVPLPDDLPPIDTQIHGPNRRTLTPFASVLTRRPGEQASFAVDLVAGRRYAMLCYLSTSKGEVHALLGMNAEFRATAPPRTRPAPGPARSGGRHQRGSGVGPA